VELSAVLPTYNERHSIVPLLERLASSLRELTYEILVIDDDSPDGTAAVAEAYAQSQPAVRVIRRQERGLASAIQTGIDRSRGQAVVWMDCDLSMPPEVVPRLHAALAAADVAVGSRYVAGGVDARSNVRLHRLFSRWLNRAAGALLGFGIRDYTSGFVCARRNVLDAIRLSGDYGEYCIDFLHRARKHGFRIVELPYRNTPRVHGESKTGAGLVGLVRRGRRYVTTMVGLRLRLGR